MSAKKKAAPASPGTFRQTFSELLKARNPSSSSSSSSSSRVDYVPILEELLDAETLQSGFPADYHSVDEQPPEEATATVGEQPSA